MVPIIYISHSPSVAIRIPWIVPHRIPVIGIVPGIGVEHEVLLHEPPLPKRSTCKWIRRHSAKPVIHAPSNSFIELVFGKPIIVLTPVAIEVEVSIRWGRSIGY